MRFFSSSRRDAAFSKSCASIADSFHAARPRCARRVRADPAARSSGGSATRTGLVDQVDRLVRQEPVVDVAVGQGRGRDQRAVGDRDPVVVLVAVAQALRISMVCASVGSLTWIGWKRRSSAASFSTYLRYSSGRGPIVCSSPRASIGEDAGGVDRALGGPGTDQGVHLVDEQDDVAAGADLLEHLLEALLEVTAVTAAGNQRAEVRCTSCLSLSVSGTSLRTIICARPSTTAVLPTPGSPMSTGLFLVRRDSTCMTRSISFSRPMTGSSLLSLAAGSGCGRTGRGPANSTACPPAGHWRWRALALISGQQLDDLLTDLVQVGAEFDQHLGRNALALADQTQQDVLGADVVVPSCSARAGELQHLLGAGVKGM